MRFFSSGVISLRRAALICVVGAILSGTGLARAQGGEADPQGTDPEEANPIDSFAETLAESLAPRWGGPRTPWPIPRPRPQASGELRSWLHPVTVQTDASVPAQDAQAALEALEGAHTWLAEHRWPLPIPDGGYGGTAGFDLYFVRADPASHSGAAADEARAPDEAAAPGEAGPSDARAAWASYDAPVHWMGLDAVDSFAVIDAAALDPARLEACVVSAYVQAALLSRDPAEAPAWRVATGDFVAWLLTGQFGCTDGVVQHQQRSWRTWVSAAPDSGEGGALFLAMLSARTDGLSGDFIRDLWSGAPQLTWEGDELRAAPDMWQVISTVMDVGSDPLERLLEEMGVARYFAGAEERERGAPMPLLRELPEQAAVPVAGRASFEQLPRRFEPHGLELEPHGSAYVVVDTSEAPPGSLLRVWLRGEHGVGWALTAVRVAEDGTERGRTRAPVRPEVPRSYIPVELTDGFTDRVVVVVTNLGSRLVDADLPDGQSRSFRLILDKVVPEGAGEAEPASGETADADEPPEG